LYNQANEYFDKMRTDIVSDMKNISKSYFLNIYYSFIALFLLMCIGILGFIFIEDYTFTEAFYMTIITMSTVGYEEVHPLSSNGMIFTSFLIIFSFGIFAYAITRLTRLLIDGELRSRYKEYKVRKKLNNISGHVIVCGFGRNGSQAARNLVNDGEKVIVIDNEKEASQVYEQNPDLIYIKGDATREEYLLAAKVESAKALITTFPSDANNLFVVLTAREFNKQMIIISRASDDHSDLKLKRAGANNVIMPDKVGGVRMAKLVSQPDIIEFVESILLKAGGEEVNLLEVSCETLTGEINKTIRELDIRKTSGANLIGLKNAQGLYTFNPSPDIVISSKDKLFVLGNYEQIKKLKSVLSSGNSIF